MHLLHLDANTASSVSVIVALLAVVISIFSAAVSVRALRTTAKQTDIMEKEFKASELARKEAARPRLTVEISKYRRPESNELRGDITFTLRNAGHVGFQVVHVRTQSGDTQNQDVSPSIEAHPGYPVEISVNLLPMERFNQPLLKAWFEIVTPDGRPWLAAEWEMQGDQFALRRSEMTDGPR